MNNSDKPAFGYGIPGDEKAGWLPENVEGLTKREYFAGLAMQGFLAGYYSNPNVETRYMGHLENEIKPQVADMILWADEMLKQLEEKDV